MFNNKRLALSIFWVVVGIALFIMGVTETLDPIYGGFGGGLIGVEIAQLIRHFRYRTNPEYKEKADTANSDERNRFLSMKAWSWTGYICVIGAGIAVIILMIIGQTVYAEIASFFVCFMLIVYWFTYVILSRKY